ncbi:MAG: AI-2E family transporter, partial [Chloroflexota bacterium]
MLGVVVLGGIVAAGIGWLLSQVGEIVILVLLAALLTFLLMPLVDWLHRRRIPRIFGVFIAYLVVAAVLAGIALAVYPPLAQQTSQLSAQLPAVMARFANPRAGLGALLRQVGLGAQADAISQAVVSRLQAAGAGILQGLLGAVQAAATAAVGFVLVIVLSFYLLVEGHDFQRTLEATVPPDKRATLQWLEAAIVRIAGGYIRGQLLVALMVAALGGLAA